MFDQFLNQLRLSYRLIVDDRVSIWTKSIPLFVAIYIISPLDLIPFIPIDDIAVLLAGLRVFEAMVPDYIVYEHRAALGMEVKA